MREDNSSVFGCELGAAGTPERLKLVPRMSQTDYTLGTSFINIICPQRLPKHRSQGKTHTYIHVSKVSDNQVIVHRRETRHTLSLR